MDSVAAAAGWVDPAPADAGRPTGPPVGGGGDSLSRHAAPPTATVAAAGGMAEAAVTAEVGVAAAAAAAAATAATAVQPAMAAEAAAVVMEAAPREAGGGVSPPPSPHAAPTAKGGSSGDTTAPTGKQRPAENVVILPSGLDSGDIVLFNRRCMSMSPYGAAICGVAKLFSNSSWDHVGIVVRRPASATAPGGAAGGEEEEELLFLEADLGGVKLRSLRERLARSKSNEIAIRRLSAVRTDEMREKMYSFAQDMLGTPYETATGQLISSIIDPLAKQERERLHALLLDKRVQLSEIDRELSEAALTAFQRRTLEKERARVDATRRAIHDRLAAELSSSADGYFESKDDLSRVFCSGLVAAAYQRVGLLESYPPAAGYSPKDFSTEQTNPPGVYLLRGARLSDEVYVRRTPKKRTADGSVAEDADAAASRPVPRVGGVATGDAPSRSSRLVISSAIKRTPINSVLSDQYKRSGFVRSFRAVVVEPGDLVFQQGSYGDSLYVVESGSLDRFVAKGSGDPKLVSTLGPGNTFGTTAVMFNSPRMSTLRAKERCLLWTVSRPTLERIQDTTNNVQDIISSVDTRRLRTLLRDHFLFKRLDRLGPEELNHFFLVKFRAGEEVFKQGDPGDNFYIIKSGELERHIRHPRPGRGSRLSGGVAGKAVSGKNGRGLLAREAADVDDEDDEEEDDEEDVERDGATTGSGGDHSSDEGGGGGGGGNGAARGRRKGRQQKRRRSSRVDDDDSDSGGAFGTGWAEKEYRSLSLTLGPGQSFGELSLMYNAPRAATVRARTDVECWAISAESFHRLHLGGGANYLRSVFKSSASVTRDGQSYMTPADVLSFANVDALPAADRERLSSLLLALVSCHRDRSRDDSIDEAALAAGGGGGGGGSGSGKRRRRARRSDEGLVDFWEFVRFDIVLNQPAAELDFAFRLADKNSSGFVDLEEIQSLLAEYAPVDEHARELLSGPSPALVRVFGPDGSRVLSYKEFCAVGDDFLPPTFRRDIRTLARHLLHDTTAETPAGGTPAAEVFEPASASLAADAALTASSSAKVRMEFSHLFAVAVSGALARTAVAPLDRLKILRQVTPPSTSPRWLRRQTTTSAASGGSVAAAARPAGTWVGLKGVVDMVRRDGGGFRALFRGNGANVIRIVPATAVQLAGVEYLRTHPLAGELASATGGRVGRAAPWETVVILGGLAGMAAAAVTYPLDVIRGRLSVQSAASFAAASAAAPAAVTPATAAAATTAGGNAAATAATKTAVAGVATRGAGATHLVPTHLPPYRGIIHGLSTAVRTEGMGVLTRGLLPTLLGVFPYVGISFGIYEVVRPALPRRNDGSGRPTAGSAIVAGALSSATGQLAAFPLDTCRRRMQVAGWAGIGGAPVAGTGGGGEPPARLGLTATVRQVLRDGGVRALFRGLVPNMIKVLPASAVSFVAYEHARAVWLTVQATAGGGAGGGGRSGGRDAVRRSV